MAQPRQPGMSALLLFVVAVLLLAALAACVWITQGPRQPPVAGPAPTSAPAPVIDHGMAYAGMPRTLDAGEPLQILQNSAYVVGYSNAREDPVWVAYKLVRRVPLLELPRPAVEFSVDERTTARVSTRDYVRSGFSRGHLAPSHALGAFYGRAAQLETFRMSNIAPQMQVLNANAWEDLEKLEIAYAAEFGTVWVIDGPVFPAHPATLRAGVQVPVAFYKLVVREEEGRPMVLAVLMPQAGPGAVTTGQERPRDYLTSVRAVEQATRLDFMWELPDPEEDAVETAPPRGLWPTEHGQ